MTPEKARELLDKATPGPWELECTDGFLGVVLQTGNGAPEECDLPLIAAAPELAEIVAVRSFTSWYRTGAEPPYSSAYLSLQGKGDVIRWGWDK